MCLTLFVWLELDLVGSGNWAHHGQFPTPKHHSPPRIPQPDDQTWSKKLASGAAITRYSKSGLFLRFLYFPADRAGCESDIFVGPMACIDNLGV